MITPKKVYEFFEGNLKMLGDEFGLLADYQKEQVLYRMEKCKDDCMKFQYCVYCGCDVPGKLYVKRSCNEGARFPDVMNKRDWEKFKEDNNIVIKRL